jgi:tetratricopeptide (TPR) repeat protein
MAFVNRGTAWFCKKDFDKAMLDYETASRLQPHLAGAFYGKARCCAHLGESLQAVASLGQSLKLGFSASYMAQDKELDSIRGDPGYRQLMNEYLPPPPPPTLAPVAESAPPPLPAPGEHPSTPSTDDRPLRVPPVKPALPIHGTSNTSGAGKAKRALYPWLGNVQEALDALAPPTDLIKPASDSSKSSLDQYLQNPSAPLPPPPPPPVDTLRPRPKLVAEPRLGRLRKLVELPTAGAALKREAEDPYSLAGWAALLLRQGDKHGALADEVLDEAGEYLNKARAALTPDDGKKLWYDIDFLKALFLGMTGSTELARVQLTVLQSSDSTEPRYGEALEALTP